jgi:hypothetical protein
MPGDAARGVRLHARNDTIRRFTTKSVNPPNSARLKWAETPASVMCLYVSAFPSSLPHAAMTGTGTRETLFE